MCQNVSEIKMREPVWSAGVGLPQGKTSRARNTTMPPFQICDLSGGKEIQDLIYSERWVMNVCEVIYYDKLHTRKNVNKCIWLYNYTYMHRIQNVEY